MSLLLRQKCQEVLNGVGLNTFHVRISTNKSLAIVGPCGQSILEISGIAFNAKTPKVVEMDFAKTLLSDFLAANIEQINEYITKRRDMQDIPLPNIPDSFKKSVGSTLGLNHIVIGAGTVVYRPDGKTSLPAANAEIIIKYIKEEMPQLTELADEYFSKMSVWSEANKKLNEVRSALQKCDI